MKLLVYHLIFSVWGRRGSLFGIIMCKKTINNRCNISLTFVFVIFGLWSTPERTSGVTSNRSWFYDLINLFALKGHRDTFWARKYTIYFSVFNVWRVYLGIFDAWPRLEYQNVSLQVIFARRVEVECEDDYKGDPELRILRIRNVIKALPLLFTNNILWSINHTCIF